MTRLSPLRFDMTLAPAELLSFIRSHCRIDEEGCWIWRGGTNGKPEYPTARVNGRVLTLRPRVFEWSGGKGPQVAVRCDKRRCLNPACMVATSIYERNAARRGKPRSADIVARTTLALRRTPRTKLDLDLARAIRARVEGGEKQITLSRELGVSRDTISKVVLGRYWREPSPWQGLA